MLDVTDLAQPASIARSICAARRRAQYLRRAHLRLRRRRQTGTRHSWTSSSPSSRGSTRFFTADGAINDLRDVKIGAVDASVFAYLADGRNGLRVLQILLARRFAEFLRLQPAPTPKLIATLSHRRTRARHLKGIDRDRAVDESGNQLAVFGRRGARPFNLTEMQRLYCATANSTPSRTTRPARRASRAARFSRGLAPRWLDRLRNSLP